MHGYKNQGIRKGVSDTRLELISRRVDGCASKEWYLDKTVRNIKNMVIGNRCPLDSIVTRSLLLGE
jgi:hypothetical protein